ncbi:MAG: PP2C family protein-serine/threonine phosphatase [Vulcanimicrobiota bacterium]
MPSQVRLLVARLDRLMERIVVYRPTGRRARPWKLLTALLLAGAFLMQVWRPTQPVVDLFVFPVLVACFFLRRDGLKAIPAALVLYHVGAMIEGRLSWRVLLLNDAIHLLEWGLLSMFVLVTLEKYVAVRQLEANIRQDLQLAKTLQTALVVREYELGKVRIDGTIHQCNDVGGDFFYFRPFQEKYVTFCLGDVMGKGISASLLMSMVMSFMFEWGKKSPSPSFVLKKLNHRLMRLWASHSDFFLAMVYAVYNEQDQQLTFAGGGHQGGLILRRDGSIEPATTEGLPLGVLEEAEYPEKTVTMQAGDRMVLCTDGVTEARSPGGDLFGGERLAQVLRRGVDLSGRELVEQLEAAVLRHTGGNYTDDLAILVFSVKP